MGMYHHVYCEYPIRIGQYEINAKGVAFQSKDFDSSDDWHDFAIDKFGRLWKASWCGTDYFPCHETGIFNFYHEGKETKAEPFDWLEFQVCFIDGELIWIRPDWNEIYGTRSGVMNFSSMLKGYNWRYLEHIKNRARWDGLRRKPKYHLFGVPFYSGLEDVYVGELVIPFQKQ